MPDDILLDAPPRISPNQQLFSVLQEAQWFGLVIWWLFFSRLFLLATERDLFTNRFLNSGFDSIVVSADFTVGSKKS